MTIHEWPLPRTSTEVLEAAGRVCPFSEALRQKIIPGVTLDEVGSAVGSRWPFAERDHLGAARVNVVSDYYLDASLPLLAFLASEGNLLTAAIAERLPVDNPLNHP
jgi:hypothetical protein